MYEERWATGYGLAKEEHAGFEVKLTTFLLLNRSKRILLKIYTMCGR